jgi:hypothetical protein
VGHLFQLQLGDKIKEIVGPATVKIVSNDGSKPVPIQLATPAPGQLIQQIVDENGILTDLIISSQQPPIQINSVSGGGGVSVVTPNNVNTNSVNTINSNAIVSQPFFEIISFFCLPLLLYSGQNFQRDKNIFSLYFLDFPKNLTK